MATGQNMGTARSKQGDALAESVPISIVIPVHNATGYLPQFLASLAENDLRGTEVIVVDDASRDGSGEMVRSFPGLEVRLLRLDRNLGPAGARNRGAAEAKYQHVLFLDADVLLPPEAVFWLRDSIELYTHRKDVIGVLGVYSDQESGAGFLTDFKNLNTCFLYDVTETLSSYLHTPILLIKKEIFDAVGGFDERMRRGEDFHLGIVLGTRGYKFVIDRRIRARHCKNYGFKQILREDWARIQELRRIRLVGKERRFALRAHRPGRLLALALPALVVVAGMLYLGGWISWWIVPFLIAAFVAVNLRLLYYLFRHRGLWFSLTSLVFLFLEMAWAELALMVGTLQRSEPAA